MPKVSIIIPCHNQGTYLTEAVESVFNQTLQDFEIIIVNDGSTDPETISILDYFQKAKMKIIHTNHQGLSAARNNGIREARGEYILPLDADDKVGEEYLERAVHVLDERPEVGIVYCEAEFFNEKQGKWKIPEYSFQQELIGNTIFCSAFFRKKDWEQSGGYNSKMIYGWEDWDFWLSLIELGIEVYKIPEVLFYYRIKNNSMTTSMTIKQQCLMRLQIFLNHKRLYKNFSISQAVIKYLKKRINF